MFGLSCRWLAISLSFLGMSTVQGISGLARGPVSCGLKLDQLIVGRCS